MLIEIITTEHFAANVNVSEIRARRGQRSAKNRSAQRAASSHCEQDSPTYATNMATLQAVLVRTKVRRFSGKICPT